MTAEAPPLARGAVFEINFVVQEFRALSLPLRRLLFENLRGANVDFQALASLALLDLLVADQEKLTASANEAFGTQLTEYFVWPDADNMISRARFLGDISETISSFRTIGKFISISCRSNPDPFSSRQSLVPLCGTRDILFKSLEFRANPSF